MNLVLPEELQRFVESKVATGEYDTSDDVIFAALTALQLQDGVGHFAPGELDALIAEAEEDFARGDVYDGEQVFREMDEAIETHRRKQAK